MMDKVSSGLTGPMAVTHHVSTPTLVLSTAAVLSTVVYFSATSLKVGRWRPGCRAVCGVDAARGSALYVKMSSRCQS